MTYAKNSAGVRQTAIFFASIFCTTAALALATPVFAAQAKAMQDTPGLQTEGPVAAPVAATPAAPAVTQPAVDPVEEELKAADLKPGDFIWRDDASAATGAVRLLVSISDQRAFLYRGDTLVAVSTVSTGRPGHRTPTGTFPITEKRAVHFSSKYDNAPMPHMQRLTNDGIALHAGHIPGRPASHGCVRLPSKFAAALFKVTQRGTPVTITA